MYACVHLPSTFHRVACCVIAMPPAQKHISCLQGYPSHRRKCFTLLLPNSHRFDKAFLPTHDKMLSLARPLFSAAHFWGLTCSSGQQRAEKQIWLGSSPAPPALQQIGEQGVSLGTSTTTQPPTPTAGQTAGGRKGTEEERGPQKRAGRCHEVRTRTAPRDRQASLGGTQQRCCSAGEMCHQTQLPGQVLHPLSPAGGRDQEHFCAGTTTETNRETDQRMIAGKRYPGKNKTKTCF